MKSIVTGIVSASFRKLVVALAACVLLSASIAMAQTGENAVYNSGNNCCAHSSAFIDASVFAQSGSNICKILNQILTSGLLPPTGVIDARGLPFTTPPTSMTCTSANPSPWSGITSPPPSTMLLPAGTIYIPSMWTLPSNTHLIGEGDGLPMGTGTTVNTTIQVSSTSYSDTSMIQFGSSVGVSGISVEKLILNGQGVFVNGIVNANAKDDSYVDHVSLYEILGTGLQITGSAQNSGPYTNVTFNTGSSTANASTACVQLAASGTRGVHGLTCLTPALPLAGTNSAVVLESSNNSIEDVQIAGFTNGIYVGGANTAKGDVLKNIHGDSPNFQACSPTCLVNVVYIGNASDLAILGVYNAASSSDDLAINDAVTSTLLSDSFVAMYAIGNEGSGDYYSRFTTSPNAASWVVGPSAPMGSCAQGSLYTCVGSAGNGSNCNSNGTLNALWACAYNSSGMLLWRPIL
jgi:hypothetical protein